MTLKHKTLAEFFGTFWLVFGGCGSAVLAAKFLAEAGDTTINHPIGFVGVALAFGLTVMTMAYAIGHISGCHLNPAVSIGLAVGGRFSFADVPAYVIAQVLGAIAAAFVLLMIAGGRMANLYLQIQADRVKLFCFRDPSMRCNREDRIRMALMRRHEP